MYTKFCLEDTFMRNQITRNGICNLIAKTNMYIVNVKFRDSKEHKIAWTLAGNTTRNLMDHMLIIKKKKEMINYKRCLYIQRGKCGFGT